MAPGIHSEASGRLGGAHPLVAAFNLQPETGNVAWNLMLAERAVTAARRAHPALRWVVLPELFTTGYAGLREIQGHAEDAEHGTSARFFASLARRLGLYVAYGFPERRRSGGVSDSASLIGPRGHLLTYRKRQLVWTTGEPGVFVPGDEVPVVRAGGARVALVICWDLGGEDLGVREPLERFVASPSRVEEMVGVVHEAEQHGDCLFQEPQMAFFLHPPIHATLI